MYIGRYFEVRFRKIEINTLSNVGSCRHVKKYKLKQTWWK